MQKNKAKPCVYCLDPVATTDDHVFSRKFFLDKDRGNLPKVPACTTCNGEKARLEHYLTTVLPFGGRHPQAVPNLESAVPPRLAKNRRLHRHLVASEQAAWIRQDGGIYEPTKVVEFDGTKLKRRRHETEFKAR